MANMLVRTPADGCIGCCLALRDADLRDDAKIDAHPGHRRRPGWRRRRRRRASCARAIRGARLEVLAQAAHIPTAEQSAAISRLLGAFFDTEAVPARREKATGRV